MQDGKNNLSVVNPATASGNGRASGELPPSNVADSRKNGATGPRTTQGKERSRRNALKHGIFSEVALLKGESRAEYDELLNGLRENRQPEGTLEEILVEKLAMDAWRRRRLIMAMTAETQTAIECLPSNKVERPTEGATKVSEKMKLEVLRQYVPLTPQFDHFLRYEASLERSFDRTLTQLERLQRMRLGQPVPPKLEVQHSLT